MFDVNDVLGVLVYTHLKCNLHPQLYIERSDGKTERKEIVYCQ